MALLFTNNNNKGVLTMSDFIITFRLVKTSLFILYKLNRKGEDYY